MTLFLVVCQKKTSERVLHLFHHLEYAAPFTDLHCSEDLKCLWRVTQQLSVVVACYVPGVGAWMHGWCFLRHRTGGRRGCKEGLSAYMLYITTCQGYFGWRAPVETGNLANFCPDSPERHFWEIKALKGSVQAYKRHLFESKTDASGHFPMLRLFPKMCLEYVDVFWGIRWSNPSFNPFQFRILRILG